MKRTVSILVSMCLFATLFAGCSKSSPAPEPKQASTQTTVNPTASGDGAITYPISQTPIKLRIFAKKGPDITPYDQLEHFKMHSKRSNITVEWEQPPDQTSAERLNIVLASGTLPDMFWNLSTAEYNQLKASGVIMPVQKYLKDAPVFNKIVKEFPDTKKSFMEPNGDVLILPLFDGLSTNDPLILRGDWLEKLGMKLPTTADEWETYWKGVRDTDLNGNGKKDEIPYSGTTMVSVRSLVAAFGMLDTFFVDIKDGNKIKYSNIEGKYKDYLTWVSRLYSEKIIDQDIATNDSKKFETKVAQNLIGSYRGALNSAFNTYMSTIAPKINGFKLYGAEPMKAADGTQLHPGCASFVRSNLIGGVVTKTNKYPAETIKWLDWFYDYTPETGGAFLNIFGPKDKTFKYGPNGEFQYTDYVIKNPDGLSTQQALSKYTTRGQHPAYNKALGSFAMWHPLTTEAYKRIEPFYNKSVPYVVQALPFTDAESRAIRSKMADITTYTDEMVIKFITGVEPVSKFDDYVKKVKSMGIDEVLATYNKAFTEWNKPRP